MVGRAPWRVLWITAGPTGQEQAGCWGSVPTRGALAIPFPAATLGSWSAKLGCASVVGGMGWGRGKAPPTASFLASFLWPHFFRPLTSQESPSMAGALAQLSQLLTWSSWATPVGHRGDSSSSGSQAPFAPLENRTTESLPQGS